MLYIGTGALYRYRCQTRIIVDDMYLICLIVVNVKSAVQHVIICFLNLTNSRVTISLNLVNNVVCVSAIFF